MAIIVGRVDDRLIHGQVATSWIRGNNIQVVVIVDDRISTDQTQISILKVSAPAEVKVYALSVDKFYEKYCQGILDDYRVMLVFENANSVYQLLQKGLKMDSINLGGMRYKEGKEQYTKALSLDEQDIKLIRAIHDLGVEVEHRQLLNDTKLDVITLINKGEEK